MTRARRIAMWSGPRNISTAMMRAFENRPDTQVVDEPFYAAYLAATGLVHPMREAILAALPTDPARVAAGLLGDLPAGKTIFYQKHMTHHMLPAFGLDWMAHCSNVFLIRAPERVVASYARKRENPTLADLGFVRQAELFAREADRLGAAPPVIDGDDVLADPRGILEKLCSVLDIPFSGDMLCWPAGRRATDGVWAPHWYQALRRPPASRRRARLSRRSANSPIRLVRSTRSSTPSGFARTCLPMPQQDTKACLPLFLRKKQSLPC